MDIIYSVCLGTISLCSHRGYVSGRQLEFVSLALYDKMCLSSCDCMHVSDTIGRCMWHAACFNSSVYGSGNLTVSLDDLVWSIAGGAWLCMFVSLSVHL